MAAAHDPVANTADVNTADVNAPAIYDPGVNAPNIYNPGAEAPEINSPAVNAPAANAPEINAPGVNAPETTPPVIQRGGKTVDADVTPVWPPVPRSRMGGVWVASLLFAVVLLLLLIFVLQNGQRAEVSFFGAHAHLPVGVALLLAAIFGILLVALPGTARIVQLRMLDRRHRAQAVAQSLATAGPAASSPAVSSPVAPTPAPARESQN